MKYLWFGLGLIATVFAFTLVNFNILEGDLSGIVAHLDDAETAYMQGDKEGAQAAVDAALDAWKTRHKYFFAVLRHEDADRIVELLTLAARGIEYDSEGVLDALIDAKSEIETVIEGETMGLGNVL